MSYALSGAAMTVAVVASYEIITGAEILPEMTGPVLALVIIAASFGYGFATRNRRGEASSSSSPISSDENEYSSMNKIKRDMDEPDYYSQNK